MEEYKCKYCGRLSTNNQGLSQHERRCKFNPNKIDIISKHAGEKIQCPYCNKYYSVYGLKNHISFVHIKDRKPKFNLEKYKKEHPNNDFSKGKTFDEIFGKEKSLKIRQKISNSLKGKSHRQTQDTRNKISLGMKKIKAGGLRQGSGRGKKGRYKGIYCDSTYELIFLIYCLDHNIQIKRCKEFRKYFWNNKWRRYYPDFIANNQIIEIKGFYSDQFKYKILYNPDIKVLFKKDIQHCFDYVDEKYSNIIGNKKDYIKLYDKED